MNHFELLEKIVMDIRIAVALSTILPVGPQAAVSDGEIARASWALPVAGLLVGLAGAAIYSLARMTGLTAGPAALLAVAATILMTGAIHEDGLADTADGFGGGRTPDRKLDIMRDSRIGTYGACALILSVALRWSALAAIGKAGSVAAALSVSHAAARAALPMFMWLVPPARSDGLSAGAGQPSRQNAMIAMGLGDALPDFRSRSERGDHRGDLVGARRTDNGLARHQACRRTNRRHTRSDGADWRDHDCIGGGSSSRDGAIDVTLFFDGAVSGHSATVLGFFGRPGYRQRQSGSENSKSHSWFPPAAKSPNIC